MVDTCISSLNPTLNYANFQFLRVGKDLSGNKWRLLTRPPDVSLLPRMSILLQAKIYLKCDAGGSGLYNIHEITSGWSENTTWINQPDYNSVPIKSYNITTSSGIVYEFDILDLVKNWVLGISSNNGILIKANNEDLLTYTSFYSSNSTELNRPIYYYQYKDRGNIKTILMEGGLTL